MVPGTGGDVGIPAGGWSPAHVLLGIFTAIVALIFEAVVVSAFDPKLETLSAQLAIQGLLEVTLVAVAVGFATLPAAAIAALPIYARLGLRTFEPSALGVAAAAYVAYIVFAATYSTLVQPEQEDIARDLGFGDGGFGAVAAAALIVAVAPISEEIFFRGFMFGGLRRRLPFWGAAAISAGLFGLLHYTGPDSIGVVPQLAVFGLGLAWLYEHTGSLWPPILVHVVNNALAFVIVMST